MVNFKPQTSNIKVLELLAPARNADTAIEAIRHGADAVYVGASAFGARVAAANQLDDIRRLVAFAHLFQAKVYVTVNTIVFEHELKAVERLITELYNIGVDALITQDMAVRRLDIPPIPLHASTQMDNRTPEKVRVLHSLGYEQVVLARELSLDEITAIHQQCPEVKLEAFVHGALCVSYSGQCFVSQALFQRSANRGECAQVCRMEFDLENEQGEKLLSGKHLLSLKDLCQIDCLELMAQAGVTSFKIEGRLKDTGYVKNVTAAYSMRLDQIVRKYPQLYCRASRGIVSLNFQPDVAKSFNRGFTHYFLFGKNDDIFAFDTPKAVGKPVGRIREVFTNHIVVEPDRINADEGCMPANTEQGNAPCKGRGARTRKPPKVSFANGDGICCIAADGKLIGFRVNRAEDDKLYPLKMPVGIRRGMRLYRNFDKQFEEVLAADSARRVIPVNISLDYDKPSAQFIISIEEAVGNSGLSGIPGISGISGNSGKSVMRVPFLPELARTPQRDNILRQFSKLGNTPLRLESLQINYKENYFIPSSLLSQWKRELVDLFLKETSTATTTAPQYQPLDGMAQQSTAPVNANSTLDAGSFDWNAALATIADNHNIANHLAREFYESVGMKSLQTAFEIPPSSDTPLMTCRHCIRYALGWCYKRQKEKPSIMHNNRYPPPQPIDKPLFLTLRNGVRLSLRFDCKRCLMTVNR